MQISGEKPFRLYIEDVSEYAELEDINFGMCLTCGNDQYCCEPDAAGYVCESCSSKTVFGLSNLLLQNRVVFDS